MEKVRNYILHEVYKKSLAAKDAKMLLAELDSLKNIENGDAGRQDFAVIGIGLNLPGAQTLDQYWNIISNGYITVGEFPDNRKKDISIFMEGAINYRKGGYLQSVDNFDAAFFNISPQEAKYMDPKQRLFLQTAYNAIEDSGSDINSIKGSSTGVFVGHETTNIKEYFNVLDPGDELAITGSHTGIMASRISYILNLKGPALVIDTACSSSLVALHTALQSLKSGECSQAIVGGVCLYMAPEIGGMVYESASNKVKAFDKYANGTVWSEGVAALLIKPLGKALRDKNNVYAVIKGSASNNDGASSSITAPDSNSQAEVIQRCWEAAGVDPETISYIETHGTGTALGDPIEIMGLTQAFQKYTDKKQFCGIGSVKNNIGHAVGCSGLASVIKLVLALKHKKIPGSAGFTTPNGLIDFVSSPVFFNDRTRDWNPVCNIRRCCVSAFGFSGTNVHVLLEEAQELENISSERQNYLFICSAKSEDALFAQISNYISYLRENENISIGDFCYTASLARGHYQHRCSIIVNTREQLLSSLIELAGSRVIDINSLEKNRFYKFIQVVKLNNRLKPDEINEGEIRRISKEVNLFVKANKESDNLETLQQICGLYVDGANIDWKEFYAKGHYNGLSMPPYPFDKKRFWVSQESIRKPIKQKSRTDGHLLLEDIKLVTKNKVIFESRLSVIDNWILQEHKVNGESVIPGTAYIEMAIAAGNRIFDKGKFLVEDIQIYTPIAVKKDEERILQFVIDICDDEINCEIISTLADNSFYSGNWTLHATGKYLIQNTKEPLQKYSLEELRQECSDAVELDLGPLFTESSFITFGPRWNCIKSLQTGNTRALVELALNKEFSSDLGQVYLHPALLDCAVSAGVHLCRTESDIYLPISYGKIKAYGSIPQKVYAVLQPIQKGDRHETIKYSAYIMDESEKCLVEIENIVLKKVTDINQLLVSERSDFHYQVRFKQNDLQGAAGFKDGTDIVVIGGTSQLRQDFSAAYSGHYNEAVFVSFEEHYSRGNRRNFTVSPDSESFDTLFYTLKNEFNITHIVYLGGMIPDKDAEELNELEARLDVGMYGLFFMTQSLVCNLPKNDLEVILLSRNAYRVTDNENIIHPENAALLGLAKAICREHPNIHCKLLDIDAEFFCDLLETDIWGLHTNFLAAYRSNYRYTETLCRFDIKKQDEYSIRENGVYVITGGTGDLGLEMAHHLASKAKVMLILTARSEFPDRNQWDKILSDTNNLTTGKINKILEIEKLGSTVYPMVMAIDDINTTSLEFDSIRSRFGRISGVIHCAGVAGDGFVFRKDFKTFYEVTAPKIQGTWILDKVTQQDKPDFMVFFSSVTSIFSGAGQGDYTAANAYLDSFSAKRGRTQKTISINWSAWLETGMAKRYNANNDGIFKALSTDDALYFFDKTMTIGESNIIIGNLNYQKLPDLVNENIIAVDQDLLIGQIVSKAAPKATDSKEKDNVPMELCGRTDGIYSDLERKVGAVWGKVLSLKNIDVFQSFYDMGGNSIMAIRLANALNETFEVKMDISDIFDLLTVEETSKYISCHNNKTLDGILNTRILEDGKLYDLFGMQNHIWFLQKYAPDSTVYQVPTYYYMYEELDMDLVKATFSVMQQTNDVFRLVFEEEGGVPKQRLLGSSELPVSFEDLSKETDNRNVLKRRLKEENDKLFDFRKPLWKVMVFKLGEKEYCLYLNIHHLITDGWSEGILLDEFNRIYSTMKSKGVLPAPPNKNGYLEWIIQEERHLQENNTVYSGYWLNEMKMPLPLLNLPLDKPRQDNQTYDGEAYTQRISRDDTDLLKELSRNFKTTINTVLLTVYYVFLSKVCSQNEIIIGIPLANRNSLESEKLVGLLMNSVCIRIDSNGCNDFAELVEYVKEKCKLAYKYGRYPFSHLLNNLKTERHININPVYQTMFQFFENHQVSNDSSLFDLNFMGKEIDGEIELRMEYATDIFLDSTIKRFMNQYLSILKQIQNNNQIYINEIGLMSKEEEEELLSQYTNSHTIEQVPIIKKIIEFALQNPDTDAVFYLNEKRTYGELIHRSDQLAALLRENSLTKGQPVAILTGRGISTVEAILSTVMAGAPYLPLDPEYPEERIQYMLKHSKSSIVIASAEAFSKFSEIDWEDRLIVFIDRLPDDLPGGLNVILADKLKDTRTEGLPDIDMHDLMYIIYTSGSTGLPKGVMVTHGNASNFIQWAIDEFSIIPSDRLMLVTSISFDISVFEIFGALASGAKLYIASPEILQDSNKMVKFIHKNQISVWHSVPSLMKQFLMSSLPESKTLKSIRIILIGGEAWTAELAKSIKNMFPDSELVNMYGPTEATIWVTSYRIDQELYQDSYSVIPIGKPIWNNNVLIMDNNGKLCPVGIPGQIFLMGKNITNGYIHDQEKTKQSFSLIEQYGTIGYKTGDIGMYTHKGHIVYLGRNDGMVKIRGYRVECGEIENVLQSSGRIEECAVVPVDDSGTNKLLCFYVVSEKSEGKCNAVELKEIIQYHLPQYMIPAHFIEIKEMPKTNNGKIDRQQLKKSDWKLMLPDSAVQNEEANEVEKVIHDIWVSLLDYEKIALNNNFFDVGGNSLLVSRMHYSIEQKFPGIITIADIFAYPTIKKLADYIMEKTREPKPEDTGNLELSMDELFSLVAKGELSAGDAADILKRRKEV